MLERLGVLWKGPEAASGMSLVNVGTEQTWSFSHTQVLQIIGVNFSIRPKRKELVLVVCLLCAGHLHIQNLTEASQHTDK